MEKLYKIKEALTRALEDSKTAKSGELQAGEIDAIHKLTDTIKNIDKICMLAEEGGEYSERGGYSSANRGQHYVRGHYSRDNGQGGGNMGGNRGGSYNGGGSSYASRGSSRGGSRGGYSWDGGKEEMMEHVRKAIESAPDEYREDIRAFMQELEQY